MSCVRKRGTKWTAQVRVSGGELHYLSLENNHCSEELISDENFLFLIIHYLTSLFPDDDFYVCPQSHQTETSGYGVLKTS